MVTAEEMAEKWRLHALDAIRNKSRVPGDQLLPEYFIEFAKQHVKATVEAILKNTDEYFAAHELEEQFKQDIINAYPEENIK